MQIVYLKQLATQLANKDTLQIIATLFQYVMSSKNHILEYLFSH
jgi:hypothetical protein